MIWKRTPFTPIVVMGGMLVGACVAFADEAQPVQSKIALKVLYAGNLGSDRAEDFQRLLSRHFETAEVTGYSSFQATDAENFDVVIFDWTSIYPRDEDGTINWENSAGMTTPPTPDLPPDFDRPAILIGAAGGNICNRLDIAINWK